MSLKTNAFGHIIKDQWREPPVEDYEKTLIVKIGLELDKETGTTIPVIAEKIDSDKLIQSYKDECGLEAAMKLIKSGMVDPGIFADDGKHGADISDLPNYAGDLIAAQESAKAAIASICAKYGLAEEDLDENDLEGSLKKAIDAKIAAEVAAQSKKEGE